MAKAPADKVFKDLYETENAILKYEKESSGTSCTYRFRIIEAATDPKIRIDVREFLRATNYTGYTSRGLTFVADQIPQVIKNLQELADKMNEMTGKKAKAKKTTKK